MYDDGDGKRDKGSEDIGLTINPRVSYWQIIQTLVVVGGVIFFVVTTNNKADQASQDVKDLKVSFATQIAGVNATINQGLAQVQQQISAIPTYGARIDQLEKLDAQKESVIGNLDTRLRGVESQTAIDGSRLDSIERASGLPTSRPKR